jgi:sortase A
MAGRKVSHGRHHVPVRRVLRILSVALITTGLVILADVAATLAWKEPVSTIYGSVKQGQASDELDRLEESFPTAADLRAVERAEGVRARARLLAERFANDLEARDGEGIGRLGIPAIDLDTVLVEGTGTATLQKGPGRYPETSLPGQGRTIGIAGHRTTYLAPFRHIDELDEGEEILIEMPYASFSYEVEESRIVEPSDVQIVDDVGYERVVLTACHPLYSAAQRIAVFGRLTEVSLFAGTDQRWLDP